MTGSQTGVKWDPSSFRDTRGRVFMQGRRVLRALSREGADDWRALSGSAIWAELQSDGAIVRSWEVRDTALECPAPCVLEHERLPFVNYSFEWPFSLLKKAALCYVGLLERLVPVGFTLIDGTSRNVMFDGVRPVFIDVLSIRPLQGRSVWVGLNQFLETILYPLMLDAHKGISFHAWLRGAPESALPTAEVARVFGWRDLAKPGVLTFLKLKHLLDSTGTDESRELRQGEKSCDGGALVLHTLRRLRSVIESLEPLRRTTSWSTYAEDAGANYDDEARRRKRQLVEAVLRRQAGGGVVWDLGCNTGEYSMIAASCARLVIAMDSDPVAVEVLCSSLCASNVRNVLPLVADVAWPSPAMGWDAAECQPLWSRGPCDLVLALALVHHVVMTRHVPCEALLATLSRLGRTCLFEFIDPDDFQARRIRTRLFEGHQDLPGRSAFEAMSAKLFTLEHVGDLTPTRSLYLLRAHS